MNASGIRRNRVWLYAGLGIVLLSLILLSQCQRIEQGIYEAGVAAERQRAGLDWHRIDTGHERIAYLERPGDGQRLVLLHGFASQKDIWLQFVHHLPEDIHVLVPDLPGHGETSAGMVRDYHAENLAAAVIRFIEAKSGEDPVHLAGSSLGGAVALLVTSRRPDRIASLSLFNPAGAPGVVADELLEAGADFDNPLIVTSRAEFDRMVEMVFHNPPVMPWPAARVLTRMHIERAQLHRKIWADVRDSRRPVTDVLEAIDRPVLLVWGERDQVLDTASIGFFADHLSDIEIQRMDNAGHTPIMEQPEASADHLSNFVRKHTPSFSP